MSIFKILLLFTLIFGKNSYGSEIPKEIVIYNGEWKPYQSAELPEYGVSSNVITNAFKLVGIDVKWEFAPWARGEKKAKEGIVDATCVYQMNKERDKFFSFSDTVLQQKRYFLHLKDKDFSWQTLADLRKYRIGITIGYFYGEKFENEKKTLIVDSVASDKLNILKVLKGRIAATPIEKLVAKKIMAQLTPQEREKLVFHPKPLFSYNYVVMFSKKKPYHRELRDLFNKGLAKLKQLWGEDFVIRPCVTYENNKKVPSATQKVYEKSCSG